nr:MULTISPECIES: glycosyltransferase family 2 protein [unclassified Halorhodospira]
MWSGSALQGGGAGVAVSISVVIPYFQEDGQCLVRALESVAAQRGPFLKQVIVVDDGSPWAAENVLAQGGVPVGLNVRLLRTTNAGVAAARNRGLDEVLTDCDYVAFLDSDDVWTEDHLARAVACLGRGYDVYCANLIRAGWRRDFFALYRQFRPEEHRPVPGCSDVYEVSGAVFDRILRNNFVGTSTVVFRWSKYSELRFEADLRVHEDWVFWLNLARSSDAFVVSAHVEARYGQGVNLYASAVGWDAPRAMEVAFCGVLLEKRIVSLFGLSAAQRAWVRRRLARRRLYCGMLLLRRLRQRQRLEAARRWLRRDPWLLVHLPISLLWLVRGRLAGRGAL